MITPDSLKSLGGAALLAETLDRLGGEAERVRQCQDALVAGGFREQWEDGQVQLRASLLAAVGVLHALRDSGLSAKSRGVKLSPVVEAAVEMARSAWTAALPPRWAPEVVEKEAGTETEIAA